jgi:flap endonuclease-1
MQHGVKAVWVFDGTPPEMKQKLLDKRKEIREKAGEAKEMAGEEGDEVKMLQM